MSLRTYLFKKRKNIIFRLHDKELLYKIDDALNEAGIFYWLDYGTLLGAIREHDFIKHDEDIDIGVKYEDYKKVPDAMAAKGIKMFAQSFVNGQKGVIQRYIYKGITFDVYFYEIFEEENLMICYSFYRVEQTKRERESVVGVEKFEVPYYGFTKYSFKEREFNIPGEVDTYLKVLYGENYMTPDPSFSVDSINYITHYSIEEKQGTKYSY